MYLPFTKWQIHPFISKGTTWYRYISINLLKINLLFIPFRIGYLNNSDCSSFFLAVLQVVEVLAQIFFLSSHTKFAAHCSNIVRLLGHFSPFTGNDNDSCIFKAEFLSEQYYHGHMYGYTMFLLQVILCNIYLYYIEEYVFLIVFNYLI